MRNQSPDKTDSPFWTLIPELFQPQRTGLFIDNWVIQVQGIIKELLNARMAEEHATPTQASPTAVSVDVNVEPEGEEYRTYKLDDGRLLLRVIFTEDNIILEYPHKDHQLCSVSLMTGTVKVQ